MFANVLPEDGAEFGVFVFDAVSLIQDHVFPLDFTQIVFVFHHKPILGQNKTNKKEKKRCCGRYCRNSEIFFLTWRQNKKEFKERGEGVEERRGEREKRILERDQRNIKLQFRDCVHVNLLSVYWLSFVAHDINFWRPFGKFVTPIGHSAILSVNQSSFFFFSEVRGGGEGEGEERE